jgi:hypothetical protein
MGVIMNRTFVAIAGLCLVGGTPALAQVAGSTTGAEVDQRAVNQPQRIQQGINSGALTSGETQRLERQQGSIAAQEQRMRARDGGELTARDSAVLNARENRASNAIYTDKHNGQVAGSTPGVGVDQRAVNQQQRIQQGVNSGSLTGGEAQRLERQQSSIAGQEQRMRARDGGQLAAHDRAVLNTRENRASNAIFRDKHNGRRAF